MAKLIVRVAVGLAAVGCVLIVFVGVMAFRMLSENTEDNTQPEWYEVETWNSDAEAQVHQIHIQSQNWLVTRELLGDEGNDLYASKICLEATKVANAGPRDRCLPDHVGGTYLVWDLGNGPGDFSIGITGPESTGPERWKLRIEQKAVGQHQAKWCADACVP